MTHRFTPHPIVPEYCSQCAITRAYHPELSAAVPTKAANSELSAAIQNQREAQTAQLFLSRKQHDALLTAAPDLLRRALAACTAKQWNVEGVTLTLPVPLADQLNGHAALDQLTQEPPPIPPPWNPSEIEREETAADDDDAPAKPAPGAIVNLLAKTAGAQVPTYDANDPAQYLRAAAAILDQPASHNAKPPLAQDIACARAHIGRALSLLPPRELDDETADRAGALIAADFRLKRSREHSDRFDTTAGTFTLRGIARRAHRVIVDTINAPEPCQEYRPLPLIPRCAGCGFTKLEH